MWQRWELWKSIESRFIFLYSQLAFLCFPLHLVLQLALRILLYPIPAFAINKQPPFNQTTPSANIHEHHYVRYKWILRWSGHTGIFFKGSCISYHITGLQHLTPLEWWAAFSTEILKLEVWTGARISFPIHHIAKWCTGYIYGLISAG